MEHEEIEVPEDKIFGMRRMRAIGTMLGLSAGMILAGLMPIFGIPWLSDIGSCILFGGAGYLIARLIDVVLHPEIRKIRSGKNKK